MNLNHARLCLDCNEVFTTAESACPKCASKQFAMLANWLNRPAAPVIMPHMEDPNFWSKRLKERQ